MPTSLVKKSVHELAPIIQCIMNKSFQTGIFPDSLKYAIVHPLIKDCKLDPDILKNYRPITNLNSLEKLLKGQLSHRFSNMFVVITFNLLFSQHIDHFTVVKLQC